MIQNRATIYHLNRSEVLIFIWNARVVIRTTQQNTHLMDHILSFFLSDTMKKPLNQLPKKFFFFFSYRQKKITLHFIYTNLNIWIISQLKIWKYLAKYFLNIYFNAIAISSNEYRNLKNSDLQTKKFVINQSSKNISKAGSLMPTGNVVFHH